RVFFQAEDGIRDATVTGVQTCALPIFVLFHFTDADSAGTATDYTATVTWGDGVVETSTANPTSVFVVASSGGGFDVKGTHSYARSEERRVGKEGRTRRAECAV